jgi:hypothetical protein
MARGRRLRPDEIQHVEAAARRTMVTGAKSKRGLDLDCDVIGLDRVAFMRAMNDEASRPYRLQPFEGSGNPVALIDAAKGCRAGGGVTRGGGDKGANIYFVGWSAQIGLDDPGPLFQSRVSGASAKAAAAVVAGSKVSTIMAAILRAAVSSQERRMTCVVPFGGRPSSMAAATMQGHERQWGAWADGDLRRASCQRRNKGDPRRKPRGRAVRPSGIHPGTSESRLRASGLPARIPRGRTTGPCAGVDR